MDNNPNTTINNKILKLYLGTYEGISYNLDLDLTSKTIANNFSFKASDNSIKVIEHHKDYIFLSGIDEIIHIYDMNKKQDKGMVVTYSGSISNLKIVKNYLIASGDEKSISLWRMSDFQNIHNLKGHKAGITSFAVHSKGVFLVSASKDNSIIIWNMSTGRKIFKYNFKDNFICNKVLLYSKEKYAVLIFERDIWVFDMFRNSENPEDWVIKKIKLNDNKRIIDAFVIKKLLIVFHADGFIKIFTNLIDDKTTETDTASIPIECAIEKPKKNADNDLDIRVKVVNISVSKKLKLLNVIYTNNQIYIFDLNKIIKSSESVKYFNKFHEINLNITDRITCLDSNLIT
jgi:WD40 repeat protein